MLRNKICLLNRQKLSSGSKIRSERTFFGRKSPIWPGFPAEGSLGRAKLNLLSLLVVTLIGLLTVSACSFEGEQGTPVVKGPTGPVVTITEPITGQTLPLGDEINILSTSVGDRGIARVELLINEQVIHVDANPQPEANQPFIVAQPWQPEAPGTYNILVRAFNTANIAGQSAAVIVNVSEATPPTEKEAQPTIAASPTRVTSPTATGADSGTVDILSPLYTPTPKPTPVPTLTPEPTPVPLPTATFAPTGLEPDGRFKDIWNELDGGDGPLGYPLAPEIDDRDFAKQYFEGGLILWWDNPEGDNYIWVITLPAEDFRSGASWTRFVDHWQDGKEYSCEAARDNEGLGPVRGFGKIWCDHPEVRASLGDPLEPEAGSGGNAPYSLVQFFQGGVMFYNPLNSEVVVMFNGDGWQKFGY